MALSFVTLDITLVFQIINTLLLIGLIIVIIAVIKLAINYLFKSKKKKDDVDFTKIKDL